MKDEHSHQTHGLICTHVINGERPVRLIQHSPAGDWDFMCGEDDHVAENPADDYRVVCTCCAMKTVHLPSYVTGMPAAHHAEFDPKTEKWTVRPMSDAEIAEYFDA